VRALPVSDDEGDARHISTIAVSTTSVPITPRCRSRSSCQTPAMSSNGTPVAISTRPATRKALSAASG
jgi:hypothetical protein